jgi:hypothetical protein
MKARLRQVRSVPDVMQPRRASQNVIGQSEPGGNLRTVSTHALHMPPPARQRQVQMLPRQRTGLSCRHHDPERTSKTYIHVHYRDHARGYRAGPRRCCADPGPHAADPPQPLGTSQNGGQDP